MFCAACGAPLEAGATFCHRCGAMLGAPVSPEAPVVVRSDVMPPMDVGGALSTSVRRTFDNLGAFIGTQGIFVLLAALVSIGVSVLVLDAVMPTMVQAVEAQDFDRMLAAMGPLFLAGGTSFVVTALLRAIGAALGIVQAEAVDVGAPVGLGEAWQRAAPRLGVMLLTILLVAAAAIGCIVAGLALFFLIVPIIAGFIAAVYLLVAWALAPAVAMLETRGVTANLRRSFELTKGHRGEIFVCLAAIYLVAAIPAGIIGLFFAPDPLAGEPVFPSATATLVSGIASGIMGLFASIVTSNFLVRLYRQRVPRSP